MGLIPAPPNLKLLEGKTLQLLGLSVDSSDEEGKEYVSLLVTVKDGKVAGVEILDTTYTPSDAINAATGWIDANYWEK
jgi:hypothetical protein